MEQIGAYITSNDAYKNYIRNEVILSVFPEYKLSLRWYKDSSFPEIEMFSISALDEKYIYSDGEIKYEGAISKKRQDILDIIQEIMIFINSGFSVMQQYGIIQNIEKIRSEIEKCAKYNITNSQLLNAICGCKVMLPFYGDTEDKDMHPIFVIDGRYMTYENLQSQYKTGYTEVLCGIAIAIKTRGKYESQLSNYS